MDAAARSATRYSSPRAVIGALEAQALASRRLGFSVTKACPLRCAHCSVSAGPELRHMTFGRAFADKVVAELPQLSAIGITCIDFTGGEPTLAADFVQRVSESAKHVGMAVGVVSAAHWATSDSQARKFLQRFRCIDHWDISTDIYHLPFVSVDKVRRAFDALSELGRPPMIRIAHHVPITYDEAVLIDRIHEFAGRRIGFQPIGPVGRGAELVQAQHATADDYDEAPCPTTGPLVRSDGGVSPCCAPLSHEDYDHPLQLGNAFREPLAVIVGRWRVNPLLQTIRLWGFEPIVQWLRSSPRLVNSLRSRQCDTCVAMARDRGLMLEAAAAAGRLENRIRVADALKTYFGEPWMEEALLAEADEHMRTRAEEESA
jgi:pyruvate-formate lyase-activating enzyme